MTRRNQIARGGLGLGLVLAAMVLFAAGCTEHFKLKSGVSMAAEYFSGPPARGIRLEKVGPDVYSFKWLAYRNLVIPTRDGIVVIDPLNRQAAKALSRAIQAQWPGAKVHTLIYSHYHLDHASGGGELHPERVVGHVKCPTYWSELGAREIQPITEPIDGDHTFEIGGRTIQALYLGRSHTDTLYAFYLPKERLVFTVDLANVRTVEPGGHPDSYHPGMVAARKRVAALDFDIFVAGHWDPGTKQDLLDSIAMEEYGRTLAREALARYPIESDGALENVFEYVYAPMKERYGSWYGFGPMFIANLMADVTGEIVGF